jgi:hypothetical protein
VEVHAAATHQDLTFGMTVDDEEDGTMGRIEVPADFDPIDDGDLLCILLHRLQGGDGASSSSAGQNEDNDGNANNDNADTTNDKPDKEK